MATFNDSSNRDWEIRICGPTIEQVREEADKLFLLDDEAKGHNTFERLDADPALFCHVIYVLCKKQCVERKIDDIESFCFAALETGEAMEAAAEALTKAHENFTPPRKREFIKAVANKRNEVEDLALKKAMAMLGDPTLETEMSEAMDKKLAGVRSQMLTQLGSATSSPVSAE